MQLNEHTCTHSVSIIDYFVLFRILRCSDTKPSNVLQVLRILTYFILRYKNCSTIISTVQYIFHKSQLLDIESKFFNLSSDCIQLKDQKLQITDGERVAQRAQGGKQKGGGQ